MTDPQREIEYITWSEGSILGGGGGGGGGHYWSKKGVREGGREGRKEGGREGGREEGREGRREGGGGGETESGMLTAFGVPSPTYLAAIALASFSSLLAGRVLNLSTSLQNCMFSMLCSMLRCRWNRIRPAALGEVGRGGTEGGREGWREGGGREGGNKEGEGCICEETEIMLNV